MSETRYHLKMFACSCMQTQQKASQEEEEVEEQKKNCQFLLLSEMYFAIVCLILNVFIRGVHIDRIVRVFMCKIDGVLRNSLQCFRVDTFIAGIYFAENFPISFFFTGL